MKIAVSEYENNVATTFDFANEVIVFTCENDKVLKREHVLLNDQFIPLRGMKLKKLGIDLLICGAISNPSAFMLHHHGIEVISGITGDVETVLQEFFRGNINLPQYCLPGFAGGGCGSRQRKGRRRVCKGGRKN